MRKYTLNSYIVFVIILPIIGFAQIEEWVARYNGPVDRDDRANAIAIDNAGNIYVTGYSPGSGTEYDYATVKYNSSGAEQWVARYNGPDNRYDDAYAIAIDNAGNIYVTGGSEGSGYYDYATIKYNASTGVEQWVARYNGPGNSGDRANAIAIDNADNIYVTGYSVGSGTSYDYATIKYNASGDSQWVARYNCPSNDRDGATAIALDNAGNVYVTGESDSSFTNDYATVKYNSSGAEQWVARYNGQANGEDSATAIAVDNSGNVYVTGKSRGSGTEYDYATVKYNSLGVEQWVTRYNGPSNRHDKAYAIAVDNAGNVYVTGESDSSFLYDYATVKYNSSGVEQWVARYNGPGNSGDRAKAIAIDNAGNIYVTGYSTGSGTYYDYATVKYNSSGAEQWVARYNCPSNDVDGATAIALDNAGNVYVTGFSWASGTSQDYATIKYSPDGVVEERATSVENSYHGATILSGPLQLPKGKTCKLFDITGRVLAPDKMKPGIYFLEIDNKIVQKVIKIR